MDEPFDAKPLITAIRDWATTLPRGYRLSGSSAGLAYLQLHTQPDPQGPEVQLTFRPVMVDGHPLIRVEHPALNAASARGGAAPGLDGATAMRMQRVLPSTAAREPDALCEGCGTMGTVGRASRTDSSSIVVESHRFCLACWPEQAARYRARWSEEDRQRSDRFLRGQEPARGAGPGTMFEAATWHNTLELVRGIQRQMIAPVAPSKEALADLASDIAANASLFEGEMPYEVEAFIRRYRAPAG
jgi:hypothetical protein